MPYSDPDRRKAMDRDRKRKSRAAREPGPVDKSPPGVDGVDASTPEMSPSLSENVGTGDGGVHPLPEGKGGWTPSPSTPGNSTPTASTPSTPVHPSEKRAPRAQPVNEHTARAYRLDAQAKARDWTAIEQCGLCDHNGFVDVGGNTVAFCTHQTTLAAPTDLNRRRGERDLGLR